MVLAGDDPNFKDEIAYYLENSMIADTKGNDSESESYGM